MNTIVYTSGEPSGIGPQLSYFLAKVKCSENERIVVLGDLNLINERIKVYADDVQVLPFTQNVKALANTLYVEHVPLVNPSIPGKMDVANAPYVLKLLDLAHEGLIQHKYQALVTGPTSKSIIAQTGIKFSGHTEYLQEKCQVKKVVMMLGCIELKVALVTTHLPIKEVSAAITYENLSDTIEILAHDLKTKFHRENPCICVAGLNPHAGEAGLLGHEEQDIIIPVLEHYRKLGFNLIGPLPADTMFTPQYLKIADAMLCMYHDQGLPVLKYVGFDHGYNTTLGLPYIRTSVDHGTALEIAGTNKADGGSLIAALDLAKYMLKGE